MNSEELEQSLRSEFENYIKDVVAEMRESVSGFQEKINADFEKHKEHLEASFRELNENLGKEKALEESFTESVTEHLKLARDEGARITATAIAEAEALEEEKEQPDFTGLSEAIAEISEKDSQSEILKSLVNHAAEFTPRGAFFIVKNEHLVGWRVFGKEEHEDPQSVREVFFPVATKTALSDAVGKLVTVSETRPDSEDDVMYRNRLGFEDPGQMHAVPLIARGRGVAVLYADSGTTGEEVNIAAIEALMKVAGLTVEVLASSPVPRPKPAAPAPAEVVEEPAEEVEEYETTEAVEEQIPEPEYVPEESFEPAAAEEQPAVESFDEEYQPAEQEVDHVEEAEDSYEFQPIATPEAEYQPESEVQAEVAEEVEQEEPEETPAFDSYDDHSFEEESEPVAFAEPGYEAEEPGFEAEEPGFETEEASAAECEAAPAPEFEETDVQETDSYQEPDWMSPSEETSVSEESYSESFESTEDSNYLE